VSIDVQLTVMAELQDQHNREVHPEWRTQGYEYYRAVWVECAELLDHYGWKWWKHQAPDLDQVKLEIVDIWHFGLSELMRGGELDPAGMAREYASIIEQHLAAPPVDFRAAVERLAEQTLCTQGFALAEFIDLLTSLPISFNELYEMYVGKNVLNNFRQAHGYKTGEYVKVWAGREDNEHLIDLVRDLDPTSERFVDDLYAALKTRYPS
jgi:dimeric dUTPase (all-alpha-NTP-PPase superfamily)